MEILLILGAALALLFLFGRRNGGSTPPPSGGDPPPGSGPAQPGGSITASIDPGDILVTRPESFRVNFTVTFGTKNAAGTPIRWPYRVEVEAFRGQERVTGFSFESGSGTYAPGTENHFTRLGTANAAVGDVLTVIARLRAPNSDAQGQPVRTEPTSEWPTVNIDTALDPVVVQ